MDRNRANCQNTAWTAEQMVALQKGFDCLFESVSCVAEPMGLKRDRKFEEKSAIGRNDEAIDGSV